MLDDLFDELQKASDFTVDGNSRRFADLVVKISQTQDPAIIPRLLDFFDDQTKYHEVFYSIVHAVERFDDGVYLAGLFSNIEKTWANSPEWITILHVRIMNNPVCMRQYRRMLGKLSRGQKDVIRTLLTYIRDNKPVFADRCKNLLKALSPISFL